MTQPGDLINPGDLVRAAMERERAINEDVQDFGRERVAIMEADGIPRADALRLARERAELHRRRLLAAALAGTQGRLSL